ncbi:MAG: DUF3179 domain-containing protein [Candidatus Omnitrophica bacterium]|nr:DUF3179 domain-containing protein [Candidatus Omnitrophota bacterium]
MVNFRFGKIWIVLGFIILLGRFAQADISDFDISNPTFDLMVLRSGGVEQDAIPAIDAPKFDQAQAAYFFLDDDRVISVEIGGEARAYPLKVLNWHEIINDQILGTPIAVTWCPLTASAVVFKRTVKKEILDFGVSGMLYNSNVVMYDRQHKGLWSQLGASALTGEYAGVELEIVPSLIMTFGEWKKNHPESLVLSQNTGISRNYMKDPYLSYHSQAGIMFPPQNIDQRLPLKSKVIGIKIKREAKAYPLENVQNLTGPITDKVGGQKVFIYPAGKDVTVTDKKGNRIPSVKAYWFAWSAFNPETSIYKN